MIETIERHLQQLPADATPELVKAGILQACLELGGDPEDYRIRVDQIRQGLDYWKAETERRKKDEGAA